MKFIGFRGISRETGIEIRSVKQLVALAKTLKPAEILAVFHRQKLESIAVIAEENKLKLKETRRGKNGECFVRILDYNRDYETAIRIEIGVIVPKTPMQIWDNTLEKVVGVENE